MSAETLRRAAALIRERAEKATPGPWTYLYPDQCCTDGCIQNPNGDHVDDTIGTDGDARHIASWHPVVALAVADWLETTAEDVGTSSLAYHAARAVARIYLNGEPS